MDAKKCDRCGRYYSEYGNYKIGNTSLEVVKPSMIRAGTKSGTGEFIFKIHFDLCKPCMDEFIEFLSKPARGENR